MDGDRTYEIRLKGHLDARWAAWFDGLSLTHESDGTTVLHWPGRRPGRAAWLAWQGARSGPAADRGQSEGETNEANNLESDPLGRSGAVAAGVIFAGIQPIHPPDVVESVTTSAWAIITPLKTAMCMLFLLGITGLYARQVEKAGWLGLAGFSC